MKKLIILILCFCFTFTSYANSQYGSIKFVMGDVTESLYIYKIANKNNSTFVLDEDFSDLDLDINDTELEVEKIDDYINQNEILPDYEQKADNHEIIIKGLKFGIYYASLQKNDTWQMDSFLFRVPEIDPISGEYKYFFEVEPKIEKIDTPSKDTNFDGDFDSNTNPGTYIPNTITTVEKETESQKDPLQEEPNLNENPLDSTQPTDQIHMPQTGDMINTAIFIMGISLIGILYILKKKKDM